MQNNAKIGGVLSIVSGAFGICYLLFIVAAIVMMALMPALLNDDSYYEEDAMPMEVFFIIMIVFYAAIGFFYVLLGVLAIVGGVFALKKKYWGWVLAGAIAGSLVSQLCGTAAIVFVCLGKDEFQKTGPAAIGPVVAPAPMEKIVG
jgi:hypothetical protein